MLIPNIQSADQVTDDQVIYLAGIAQTLSTQTVSPFRKTWRYAAS